MKPALLSLCIQACECVDTNIHVEWRVQKLLQIHWVAEGQRTYEYAGSGTSEDDAASVERRNRNWIEPPNAEDIQIEESSEGDEPDEVAITAGGAMKVVGCFSTVRDNKDLVNTEANLQRIDKFSWMIENIKLDVRNYNSMLLLTRKEMDDAIATYKHCLVQNNWEMQNFLDTNLGVRRQETITKHDRQFDTREEASQNKLVFTPWWREQTQSDIYT